MTDIASTSNLIALGDLIWQSEQPTDWLIEGIYPTAEAILMSGPSHSGKTYILLDQGLAVAYGRPWLGRYKVPEARPVIYAPSEGRRGIGIRVRSAIEYHYPHDEFPEFYVYSDRLNLTRMESTVPFLKAIEEVKAALVIVDVLRDATPGISENSDEMGDAFGLLRDIAHETGATVLVAHHFGKDKSRGSRGHSSLKDKADQEILVSSSSFPAPDGGVLATSITMENSKNRNEDNWGRISLELRRPEGLRMPVIVRPSMNTYGRQGMNEAALTYLRAIGDKAGQTQGESREPYCTINDICESTGNQRQTVAEALKRLEGRGFVDINREHKPQRISLTDEGRRLYAGLRQGDHDSRHESRQGRHPLGG